MAFASRYAMRGFSPRESLNQRYKMARNNLLLIIIFTLINCRSALLGGTTYFLFSAFIPYILVTNGMDICGKFPDEFYLEVYGDSPENFEFLGDGVLVALVVLALIGIALYLLAWIFSKKHKVGWLIFALVFFSLDTLATFLLGAFDITMIVDYIFHGLVIFELATGIHAHSKWKAMAEEPVLETAPSGEAEGEEDIPADSTPLRNMDRDVKNRVLAEAEFDGHRICYRRVGKVNELIVDGVVYDEYTARAELPHELSAQVGGHFICAGLANNHSYIMVDGNELVSKMRWI